MRGKKKKRKITKSRLIDKTNPQTEDWVSIEYITSLGTLRHGANTRPRALLPRQLYVATQYSSTRIAFATTPRWCAIPVHAHCFFDRTQYFSRALLFRSHKIFFTRIAFDAVKKKKKKKKNENYGASSNRQDESPSQGLSLNRSQRGNCSTEYNTPPGT